MRIVPPQFKHVMELQWFRKFTWQQRLFIALGCPVKVDLKILCEHSPGKISSDLMLEPAPKEEAPK